MNASGANTPGGRSTVMPYFAPCTTNDVKIAPKIKYLRDMGCVNVGLGVEAGGKYIRDKVIIKPKFENSEAIEKINLFKKRVLETNWNWKYLN